jgi:fatty acid desaturase
MRREISALRVTTPQPWRSAGHLALAWAIYAGAALWIVSGRPDTWVRIGLWIAMGFLILGNGAVVHETLHGHLFNQSWLNRAVGVVAGTTVGLPWSTYRYYHLGHHQASCTPEDPEGLPYRFSTRWYYALIPVGGPLFALQFVWWTVRTIAGSPPPFVRSPRQRRDVIIDGLTGIAFYAAMLVVGLHDPRLVIEVWLVPWLFAVVVLEPMVLIPEHYGASVDDADFTLRTTRTVQSNRVVTWLYWGNNFHTAHHLAPGVVPQHIRLVSDTVVAPRLDAEWKATGYLAFHRRLIGHLPWRA